MLNIYPNTYEAIYDNDYLPFFYPFWGKKTNDDSVIFDTYITCANESFSLTSIDNADIGIFPFDLTHTINNKEKADDCRAFLEKCKNYDLPAVTFFHNDYEGKIGFSGSFVFRTSLSGIKKLQNEHSMPAWTDDFLMKFFHGNHSPRNKNDVPVVGFMGLVVGSKWPKIQKKIFDTRCTITGTPEAKSQYSIIRALALKHLMKSQGIIKNIHMRKTFWGGLQNKVEKSLQQREFVQNIVNSDYTLCARGAGNFSYRLYETLCCGRIPIFINTDCVLPFNDIINWKDLCIWVEEEEIPDIADIIIGFHQSISNSRFIDMQKKCREVWENYLSPLGFYTHMSHYFTL